jgi:hypothetical protein
LIIFFLDREIKGKLCPHQKTINLWVPVKWPEREKNEVHGVFFTLKGWGAQRPTPRALTSV